MRVEAERELRPHGFPSFFLLLNSFPLASPIKCLVSDVICVFASASSLNTHNQPPTTWLSFFLTLVHLSSAHSSSLAAVSSLQRSEPPISPRHHGSNNRSSDTISSIMQNPLPSMILRDTSIREQLSSSSIKDSAYFNGNSGYNSSTFSSRERDCSSPFLNSSSGPNNLTPFNNPLSSLGSRDNNSAGVRDAPPVHNSSRASNRFLYGGLDQRIIKQSSEDCRRLLQQVSLTSSLALFVSL